VPLKRHQRRHVWSNTEWGEELKLSYLKFSIRTKRTIIIKNIEIHEKLKIMFLKLLDLLSLDSPIVAYSFTSP
jgi:hypothetical protein